MPNLTFEYHPEAILEAHHAYHWYDAQSDTAADRFWEEPRRVRLMATDQPELGIPYFFGTRAFRLKKFPYGLVYAVRDKQVIGLAVCHFKRRPSYWKGRITSST
jgi:plasmid stabilization system protein ParE